LIPENDDPSAVRNAVAAARSLKVLEAVPIFNNEPNVDGPDDPLDREDFCDLTRLGLWLEDR
jgi:hypothetical protein